MPGVATECAVCPCPAAYKFIGQSLNATPAELGSITLTRALVQALSSPIGGLLGDRLDRRYIVAFGCVLWGVMTAAIGLSTTLQQASCPLSACTLSPALGHQPPCLQEASSGAPTLPCQQGLAWRGHAHERVLEGGSLCKWWP